MFYLRKTLLRREVIDFDGQNIFLQKNFAQYEEYTLIKQEENMIASTEEIFFKLFNSSRRTLKKF